MYERSVIVLERYTEEILGLNKSSNLKNNFYTYKEMVEEEKVYSNKISNIALGASSIIEKGFNTILNYLFSEMNKAVNS